MRRPSAARRFLRDVARAASWHRRKLAVLAAVGAVLTGIAAVAPDGPPTVAVVRTTSRLAGGATVTGGSVRLERLPEAALPEGALTDPVAVIGRTVLGPVAAGAVLTSLDLVSAAAIRPGHVVAPLRLADADVANLVRAGDRVDVLAAEPEAAAAALVARSVRVVTVPEPVEATRLAAGSSTEGALLLVEVVPEVATRLAQAAVSAQISIVLR
ncbi:MAG: RcpC/CpaB family pilus assembly protein [Actinomycetes bacterium]